ncbi:alpha/beta hydrolase [Paraburkholderia sp. D15]|uniref:alpha/beta hydrolase n=1 Tax=Paraburkholderia sp. D15 TaxID=2880218 RepID=UPI002478EE6B|nr:alpha/beta hydrolase [Paraburkholderia sp. D15]WGS54338.1 alpha/beta hydrolase [Paraburkholderia sp. D15]
MTQPSIMDDERAPNERPVAVVASRYLQVSTPAGSGTVPVFANGDWLAPAPTVRRVVILIHGRLRNGDTYFELAQRACESAGASADDTLLIVPQFLASADLDAHALPSSTLHWDWTGWMGGDNSQGPAPLSSFDVLDAILHTLASREQFGALTDVVIAGHSGGGQVVQRYAVVARGDALLTARGVALRYVVANPSSYVYFDAMRPDARGEFVAFDAASCSSFNRWKYGLEHLPAYAKDAGASGTIDDAMTEKLEARYVQRDVTVLLGGADCDPQHPALDRSCAARAQGAHRLERGLAYARYMASRHPRGLSTHRTFVIDGVGHDAGGIFTSARGREALFGTGQR